MPATETKNTVLKLRQPTGSVEIASDGYTPVTKNMHGAYVDHQSQMILVSEPDADNTHEVLTDTTRLVTLCHRSLVQMDEEQGVFNGVDTIQWSNGSRWTRLKVTESQYRFLTRRPYVPLTFLAFDLIRSVVRRLYECVV